MTDRSGVLFVLFTLVATVLAGCLAAKNIAPAADTTRIASTYFPEVTLPRAPAATVDLTKAIDPTHGGIPDGHAVAALHTGAYGLKLAGYNPLTIPSAGDGPVSQDSGFIAMDTWGHYACVAHFIGTGGATIVDIADPAKPKVISSVESGMLNSDCQFTDDGDYLLLAAYTGVGNGLPVPPPVGDAASNGVLVYDVKDKAQPKFLYHDTVGADGNSYHNVFTAKINGVNYVFQTYTGNILALEPGASQLKSVSKLPDAQHDIWVGHHPVTGAWIMITGSKSGGARIYDLTDPAHPLALGEWAKNGGYTGWHRQWPLLNTVEGHALMMVAGEDGGGKSLPYTVLDFTNPNDLVELGHWQIPGNPTSNEPNFYTLSAHEFETWNGYVATGNYHAGVWLIDIGTMERAKAPATIGYYLPHEVPATAQGTTNKPFAFNPDVWGAYFDEKGNIYTADWGSGLYVLQFGEAPR